MKIIRHTASVTKSEEVFKKLITENSDMVELDFIFDKNGIPIWSHNPFKLDNLSIYDIIEINNHRKRLLIEFKYVRDNIIYSEKFLKLLIHLSKTDDIDIQTFNLKLVKFLINNRDKYPNIEIGLIINLFKRKYLKEYLSALDFVSMSNELWELTDDYNKISNIKKYAWSWDMLYSETSKRIQNYVDKNADGIIVNDIESARAIIKK